MNKKFVVFLLILLAIALVAAVFKSNTSKLDSNKPKETRTIKPVEQSTGSLVKDYPEFPSYPNAELTSSQHSEPDSMSSKNSFQSYYETSDSVAKIMKWYVSTLKTQGWTITRMPDPETPTDQNIAATKGSLYATVNAEEEGDEGTTISVYISTN